MSAIWATNTAESTAPGARVALAYGEAMAPGEFIDSPSGVYRLGFQVDGNLVLLHLPSGVLWASGTDGQGATSVQMQSDGNLVVYAGATALWGSATAGNPGAYLVLQNDGNLVIYSNGGIESLGVMSLPPNWRDTGITETLAWLTSVTETPLAVEQRMGLRISPRQMFEVNYTLWGGRRTYFDLLVMAGAGSPLYLPSWQDPNRIAGQVMPGGKTITVDTTNSELQDCRLAVLLGDDPFTSEVVEVFERSAGTMTLVAGVALYWPAGSRIYPCKKVKVETQPSGSRHADRAYEARTRFLALEPNPSSAAASLGTFMGNYVLEEDPNDAEAAAYNYDRKMFTLDENVGLQQISNVAGFMNQAHAWFAKGRAAQWRLRGLFYALEGRRVPIWVPSYFADFDLALPINATDTAMTVRRCGYTDAGGPFKNREYIVIHLESGTRLYRKIVAAAVTGGNEVLGLDSPTGQFIRPEEVRRISFLSFCRLDQDSVELVHHTDTRGLTTVNAVFRTDPGIAGVFSETEVEVPPLPPGGTPPPPYDPFKPPVQKLLMFNPFAAINVPEPPDPPPDWTDVSWQGRQSDAETGFPSDLITVDIGNRVFTLPADGSFRISTRSYFTSLFGIPHTVGFRVLFLNSTLDPIELTDSHSLVVEQRSLQISKDRVPISAVIADPEASFQIVVQFRAEGFDVDEPLILGMNVYAVSNPPDIDRPYQSGDSLVTIEWWP